MGCTYSSHVIMTSITTLSLCFICDICCLHFLTESSTVVRILQMIQYSDPPGRHITTLATLAVPTARSVPWSLASCKISFLLPLPDKLAIYPPTMGRCGSCRSQTQHFCFVHQEFVCEPCLISDHSPLHTRVSNHPPSPQTSYPRHKSQLPTLPSQNKLTQASRMFIVRR